MARAGDGKVRSEKRRAMRRLSKRVTEGELTAFERRARDFGYQSGQEFLSAFVLGNSELTSIEKRDLTLVLGHLGKIGSNLNQIAKRANAGKITDAGAAEINALKASLIALDKLGFVIRDSLK